MTFVRKGEFKWTPEAEAKLMGLFEYGLRARDVAEEMGITICAAEARYRKLKKKKAEENDG
jgi:hypothetical protein